MRWRESIKRLRLTRGLKQSALADILGVDQSAVSRWESGKDSPNLAAQVKLRELMNEALAPRQDRWLKLLVRNSTGAVLTARDLKIVEVSEQLAVRSKLTREDVIGHSNFENMRDGGARMLGLTQNGFFEGAFAHCRGVGGVARNGAQLYTFVDIWPVLTSDGDRLMLNIHTETTEDLHREFRARHPAGFVDVSMEELVDE